MALTDEQKKERSTGIGASEIGAILEISPMSTPMDVWLSKTGRAEKDKEDETDETILGTIFEPALCAYYEKKTGRTVRRSPFTRTHPEHPRVKASPDVLVFNSAAEMALDGGVELKLVGHLAHHWAEDTLPDYVEVQARQLMAVFNTQWWDVLALINSTKPRLHRVERDLEIEAGLIETCEAWWDAYVATDTPPPVNDPFETRKMLRAKYPYRAIEKEAELVADKDHEAIHQMSKWLEAAHEETKRMKGIEAQLTNAFIEIVGERYGVRGTFGKFLHYPVRGEVNWRAVAEELAVGAIPEELVEKHRGEGKRVPRHYPFKPKGTKSKKG